MEYTREDARARVDATPELWAHRETVLYDWPEGAEHWEWVCTAPVAEIVGWSEAVERAYTTAEEDTMNEQRIEQLAFDILVEEWREYTATAEEDNTMNESSWHRCVDCDTELGPAPGADGSGHQCGVTFCLGCGAMYRWDFWRLNRYSGDTGSI